MLDPATVYESYNLCYEVVYGRGREKQPGKIKRLMGKRGFNETVS